ncbi:MAG: alpha-galactosidase [Armatimonadetes bacterium]|nr:alpha-galactosidase [Armatimonadota bacterium]
MHRMARLPVVAGIALCLAVPALGLAPTADELSLSRNWAAAKLQGSLGGAQQNAGLAIVDSVEPPFSFVYGGQSSTDLLKTWKVERSTRKLDKNRAQYTCTYTDPKTGLVVRCVAVEYSDYPTVEWTVYFKNAGSADTPILENIQALDIRLRQDTSTQDNEFVLYHNRGTPCSQRDYEPFETKLIPQTNKTIAAEGGRPTNSDLSYFNLRSGNQGIIIVVGWPGQWSAKFTRDEKTGLGITAGQELTHFKLLPGEEARTPLMVVQFWQGDRYRSQNIWRRWMLAYNVPRPGGKPLEPMTGGFDGYYFNDLLITEAGEKWWIDQYAKQGLTLDYWWIDAGWYVNSGTWMNTGTWKVDRTRFPGGIRDVTDYARSKGIKRSIVWFEPERATFPNWIHDNHPDWLLGPSTSWQLVDLGNPETRKWVTDHIDTMLREERIDAYRQDFNIDPLPMWRANDAPDRQGITENRHVCGYLAFWDELLRRHPNLMIDSCASGGRRNDLETLRRSVPLWRSDWAYDPVSMQCLTYGISLWMPYYGTGVGHASGSTCNTYTLRSDVAPFVLWAWDMRRTDIDFDLLRRWMRQWRNLAPNYLGDYYPLTSYSTEKDVWMAWQFNRPEEGEGVVQVFRRAESSYETARYKLRDLDTAANYVITELDAPSSKQVSGKELAENGLLVNMPVGPSAVVFTYKKNK